MLSLHELLSSFPSLADAPRELPALEAWFDEAGLTEQAVHACAFVLQHQAVAGIEFAEDEALYVWDHAHRTAYRDVLVRLSS